MARTDDHRTINLRIPTDLLDELDRQAHDRVLGRAKLIELLLRKALADLDAPLPPTPRLSSIVCPGHGPMQYVIVDDRVIEIRCATCGQSPVDLLAATIVAEPEPTLWAGSPDGEGPIEAIERIRQEIADRTGQMIDAIRLQPCGTFHRNSDDCPLRDPRCAP